MKIMSVKETSEPQNRFGKKTVDARWPFKRHRVGGNHVQKQIAAPNARRNSMKVANLFYVLVLSLAIIPAELVRAADFPAVITDNATGDEPAIETGVKYTTDPAFDNPPDTTGRRLIDRDLPYNNWNNVTGMNYTGATVTFDFQRDYRFNRFAVLFRQPRKPASVECSLAATKDGPWTAVGVITPKDGWNELKTEGQAWGRYARLVFKLDKPLWYVSEVKAWGVPVDDPNAGLTVSLVREGNNLVLVKDGKPAASIVVAADASPQVIKQARFLQKTVAQITGGLLPLRDDSRDWEGGQVLIGPSKLSRLSFDQGVDQPQGYRIVVAKNKVALNGNDAGGLSGTTYAVYDLLEQLG